MNAAGLDAIKRSSTVRRLVRPFLSPIWAYIRHSPVKRGKLALWNAVVAHTWWLETERVARTTFGAEMRVDAREIVGRYISYFGVWEPNLTALIRQRLRPGDVFVDAGANVGYFTLLASQLVGAGGRVIAIEVAANAFRVLEHNIAANQASNVRAVNVGVWDRPGELSIVGHGGETTLVGEVREGILVPVLPIAEILRPDEIERARFLKVDVEGAEWHALMGLIPVLPAMRRDLEIALELSPTALQRTGHSAAEVLALLADHGFDAYLLDNDYTARRYLSDKIDPPVPLEELPDWEPIDLFFSRRWTSS